VIGLEQGDWLIKVLLPNGWQIEMETPVRPVAVLCAGVAMKSCS